LASFKVQNNKGKSTRGYHLANYLSIEKSTNEINNQTLHNGYLGSKSEKNQQSAIGGRVPLYFG